MILRINEPNGLSLACVLAAANVGCASNTTTADATDHFAIRFDTPRITPPEPAPGIMEGALRRGEVFERLMFETETNREEARR